MFIVCLLATAVYISFPSFLVSIGILRYRYPFDLVYALFLGGAVVMCAGGPRWIIRKLRRAER